MFLEGEENTEVSERLLNGTALSCVLSQTQILLRLTGMRIPIFDNIHIVAVLYDFEVLSGVHQGQLCQRGAIQTH